MVKARACTPNSHFCSSVITSDGHVDAHNPHPIQVSSLIWAMGADDIGMGPKIEICLSCISSSMALAGQASLQEPQPLHRSSLTCGKEPLFFIVEEHLTYCAQYLSRLPPGISGVSDETHMVFLPSPLCRIPPQLRFGTIDREKLPIMKKLYVIVKRDDPVNIELEIASGSGNMCRCLHLPTIGLLLRDG